MEIPSCIPVLPSRLLSNSCLTHHDTLLLSAASMKAKEVLEHIRDRKGLDVEKKFLEICAVAEDSKPSSPIQFARVLLGRATNGAHLGRRAWLCLWLQIMASWTGITAVTAYSPVLLMQVGYSNIKQNGLASGLNTIGIVGSIISAQIVDRYGRRKCLIWGACGLSLVNLIAASLYEGSIADPSKAAQIAPAAVTMLFSLILSMLHPGEPLLS
jgi:hypothetical protein